MNRNEKVSKIRKICVYCGSGPGTDPAFVEAGRAFGATLASNGIGLVFGGGSVGMMGAIAKSVLDHGGFVTGVIPDFLVDREHMLLRVQERIVTPDMHARKRTMFERADAFVGLPGGIGTLEELVEQLTWAQLGRHKKPILVCNIERFWDPLRALIDHMKRLEFIRPHMSAPGHPSERHGGGPARPDERAGRRRARGAGSEPECTSASADLAARG